MALARLHAWRDLSGEGFPRLHAARPQPGFRHESAVHASSAMPRTLGVLIRTRRVSSATHGALGRRPRKFFIGRVRLLQ